MMEYQKQAVPLSAWDDLDTALETRERGLVVAKSEYPITLRSSPSTPHRMLEDVTPAPAFSVNPTKLVQGMTLWGR